MDLPAQGLVESIEHEPETVLRMVACIINTENQDFLLGEDENAASSATIEKSLPFAFMVS